MSGPRLAGNSSYTLSVIDFPINYDIEIGVIEDHADAAIQHLGEHIEWKGVLDFVVKYDKNLEEAWDPNGPGFYSYDTHTGDKTVAQIEATTGTDANDNEYDLGSWVSPLHNTFRSYGDPTHLDTDLGNWTYDSLRFQDLTLKGQTEVLSSVFLHEFTHGLVDISSYSVRKGSDYFLQTPNIMKVNGGPVRIDREDCLCHFAEEVQPSASGGQGGWRRYPLSEIDLALLKDAGYNVKKDDSGYNYSSVFGSPGKRVKKYTLDAPLKYEKGIEFTSVIRGTEKRDRLKGSSAGEIIAGGKKRDKLTGGGGSDAFYFDAFGEFGKKNADIIFDFDYKDGDVIILSPTVFRYFDEEETFLSKKGVSKTLNKISDDEAIIYDSANGGLYYNANGSEVGLGDNGGLFAVLKNKPDLALEDVFSYWQ